MRWNRSIFRFSWLLTFLLAAGGILHAQVGRRQEKPVVDDEIGEYLLGPALWVEGRLPGPWRQIGSQSELQAHELQVRPLVFGERVQNIQAFLRDGKPERLVVVYLEAGFFFSNPDAKRRDFSDAFRQLERALPEALATVAGGRGRRFRHGQGDLAIRATEYTHGDLLLRLFCDDDQLVNLVIESAEAADRTFGARALASRQQRRRATDANVERRENGDVLILDIPMSDQHDRSYCAVATLAMILQYHGLNVDVDTLAARAGYRQGNTAGANILDIYKAAARMGNLRFSTSRAFNLRNVKRSIDRGEPVLVWREFSRSRDEFHSRFAAEFAGNPEAELPNPRSREGRADRRLWPDGKDGPGHASIITGYNDERDEIIFTESWGESFRNRRMRAEEAEETARLVIFFGL